VPPVVPLIVTVVVALCPFFVPRDSAPARSAQTLLVPAVSLVYVALLFAYVFGEDSYRGNGISRWDAYRSPGGVLEPMFWATVALMVLAVGSTLLAIVQGRARLMRTSAIVAAAVAVLLGIPTIMGFSLN
jgi:hypothetical protein